MNEKQINELRIAFNLVGIQVDNLGTEIIIETIEKSKERGGKFSINDALEIVHKIAVKYGKN